MKKYTSWNNQNSLQTSVRNRKEYIDYDYLHKLNPVELDFLKGFTREVYSADFKHNFKQIYTSTKDKKGCYDLNNSRNRCQYGLTRGINQLIVSIPVISDQKPIRSLHYLWLK